MEKRYVAGKPLDRDALLKVLQKYEVDELWVDFKNPFKYKRRGHGLYYIYIIWNSQDKADKYWGKADTEILILFDPDFDSDEDEVVAAVELMTTYSIGLKHMLEFAKSGKRHVTKIYDKETGFIGCKALAKL